MTELELIRSHVESHFATAVADLCDLVRIPSVSASSFDQSTLERSAETVAAHARALGLTTEILRVDGGRPAVVASRPAAEGYPTVLLYAHHDVQPEGDLAGWLSHPYEPEERNGRLYGRGAADDKAGVLVHLSALRALESLGLAEGLGVTLFIEGEEEIGSPSFRPFLETYTDKLKADVIIVADSNNWRVGTPSLTTSLRGVVSLTVTLSVLDHALHSGMYGGPVIDAVTLACRLISTLHDADGAVAVEGLAAQPVAQAVYAESDLRTDTGILDGVSFAGRGDLASRLWTQPSISVIGMDVTPVDKSSNTLIPSCRFEISLRVTPGQDSAEAARALEDHLRANVPFGAHLDIEIGECGPSFQATTDTHTYQLARHALQAAWETEPVDIGVGGSIPFISDLSEVFPQADILVTGIEDPDTRAHSQNESLDLGDFKNAIIAEAVLLTNLAHLPGERSCGCSCQEN